MTDHSPEEPKTSVSESKPEPKTYDSKGIGEKLGQYWPDWLPRSHGSFAMLLLVFVLFGWATDTKEPQKEDYVYQQEPYSGTPDPGDPPVEPDAFNFDLDTEEGKTDHTEAKNKYGEDKKKYDEQKKKYEGDSKAYNDEGESINEDNKELLKQYKDAMYSWTTKALSRGGMTGKDFAIWRVQNGQFMAKLIVITWLTYCVFTMLLGPTLKAVPKHFGSDFGVVITPLVLLGILFALAGIIDKTLVESPSTGPSIAGALQKFVSLIKNAITEGITNINTFVFGEWHIPVILITITATFGLQRILGSRSKSE